MYFKDKIIWITGASSGIGAELAKQLAILEAKLILTARNESALLTVQKNCLQYTACCTILPADVCSADTIEVLVQHAIAAYGNIDIVIHSAGITQRSLAINTDMSVYRQLMEVNFFAPAAITKYLLPHFKEKNSGHIVVIGSMAGLMGFPMRTGYAAAKHAVKGFFETLQVEHTIPGLYITIVSPGRIKTPISLSALTANGSPHNKMDAGQLNGIPVVVCAQKIMKGIEQKRKHIIIARGERILYWLWWYCPPLYYRIARKKGMR